MNAWLGCGVLAAVATLAGCSGSGGNGAQNAQPSVEVSAVMPVRQTFHREVSAFGQLAVDSRGALSLSLPQAAEIIATDVVPGRRVKRGAALLKVATNPAARSAYVRAQAAVAIAREDLARAKRLLGERLATNAQLDAARQALTDAEANLAAQAKLGGAHATTILRAPAAGVVTALAVQRGQRVAAGTPLVEFAPANALVARLGIDPGAARSVRVGMGVSIEPVYAAAGAPPLRATVAMVGDAVNPLSHLVDVIATPAAHTALPTGTALSASITTAPFAAWAVPRNALQSDAQGSYVYEIVNGKAKRVGVKVVAPDGSPIGVEGALAAGVPVITLGSYEISAGDPVHTAAPAPSPPRKAAGQ